jgi:hypothetical protein
MTKEVREDSEVDSLKELRKQLLALLNGGNAHADLDSVVKDFPAKLQGITPEGLPYSAWQLLEHIRITQEDILRFSRNYDSTYESPKWPEEYWPKGAEPPNDAAWNESVRKVKSDLTEFIGLLTDSSSDLFTPFAWGDGQNLLREALVIADHAAYHLGEMLVVRRLLGAWKKS